MTATDKILRTIAWMVLMIIGLILLKFSFRADLHFWQYMPLGVSGFMIIDLAYWVAGYRKVLK